ncbi:hypothetical protein LCGC14_0282130 [marine sediment metagenome]|uniref:Uncharacterized protein n=1 Tax=marine sediment metagenome TaxID=412755 RepID=A0A0F9U0F5_9ZZZZ
MVHYDTPAIHDLADELQACMAVILNARTIKADTKAFLHNQGMIYASYLSDAINASPDKAPSNLSIMCELINSYCDLVNAELPVAA